MIFKSMNLVLLIGAAYDKFKKVSRTNSYYNGWERSWRQTKASLGTTKYWILWERVE